MLLKLKTTQLGYHVYKHGEHNSHSAIDKWVLKIINKFQIFIKLLFINQLVINWLTQMFFFVQNSFFVPITPFI
jgi:hypothetical protein